MILLLDFNAKHPTQGSRDLDNRGVLTMDFIVMNGFKILNIPELWSTFQTCKAEGFNDLTMVHHMSNRQWSILEDDTTSDHKFLNLSILQGEPTQINRIKFKWTKANWREFGEVLTNGIRDTSIKDGYLKTIAEKISGFGYNSL